MWIPPNGAFWWIKWLKNRGTSYSLSVFFCYLSQFSSCKETSKSLQFSVVFDSGCCTLVGPAIPAFVGLLAPLVFVLNILTWATGWLGAILRWNRKPTFWLLLGIDWSLLGLAMWSLNSARLVSRSGPRLAKMSRPLSALATPAFAEFFRLGRAHESGASPWVVKGLGIRVQRVMRISLR